MKAEFSVFCFNKQYPILVARRGACNLNDLFLQNFMETN